MQTHLAKHQDFYLHQALLQHVYPSSTHRRAVHPSEYPIDPCSEVLQDLSDQLQTNKSSAQNKIMRIHTESTSKTRTCAYRVTLNKAIALLTPTDRWSKSISSDDQFPALLSVPLRFRKCIYL